MIRGCCCLFLAIRAVNLHQEPCLLSCQAQVKIPDIPCELKSLITFREISLNLKLLFLSIISTISGPLLAILIILAPARGNAQQEPGNPGKIDTLGKFAAVYMAAKDIPSFSQEEIRQVLKEANMSIERYGEILTAEFEGKKVDLTKEELIAVDKIRVAVSEEEERREEILRDICASQDLPYTTYREILRRYRSEVEFQRMLKPYFDRKNGYDKN